MYLSGITGSSSIKDEDIAETIKSYVDQTISAINSYISKHFYFHSINTPHSIQ